MPEPVVQRAGLAEGVEAIVELTDVAIEYPKRGRTPAFRAVEGLTLQLGRGEVMGLVGESGSGKSSIATVLTGGQKLSSGQVFVDGQAVSTRPNRAQRRRRADIGVVFQDPRGAPD